MIREHCQYQKAPGINIFYAEPWVERTNWDKLEQNGVIRIPNIKQRLKQSPEALLNIADDVREYLPPTYEIPVEFHNPYHQPHLMNFFNAIRGTEALNCPAETGYNTAVTVLKINEAVAQGKRLDFKPDDFYPSQT